MSDLESCKQNVTSVLSQRDGYQPKESAHHLHVIDNYLDHLHLDKTFLESSREWRSLQDPNKMARFVAGANQAVTNANATVSSLRPGLTMRNATNMPDNMLRHYSASTNLVLQTARADLHPYAQDSRERIQQFSDMVGVTDRFNGYRNNMSRNRQAFKLDTQWARQQLPAISGHFFANEVVPHRNTQRFNVVSSAGYTERLEPSMAQTKANAAALQSRDRSVDYRNWRTDYMIAFAPKVRMIYGRPLPLNAGVDYTRMTNGRPLAGLPEHILATEYSDRYINPREQVDTHRLKKSKTFI